MLKPKHTNRFSIARFRRTINLFVCFFLLVVGVFSYTRVYTPTRVEAAPSSTLNFQARLYSANGNIVSDGNYHIEFKIYDSLAAGQSAQGTCVGGGTDDCLWVETRTTGNLVSVKNGYFSVNLGEVTAFPNINWDQDLHLTMNIGGAGGAASWDGEMSPRIKLTSVPYAFQANTARELEIQDSGFTGNLQFDSLTNNRNILLPDASGTVLLDSTLATTAFIQNGNSFGQTAVLGTNDAFGLQLETNGVTRLTIDATGNTTLTGTLAVNGDQITSDGATLVVNAGGTVDIQDNLTADSLTLDTGDITLRNGEVIANGTDGTIDVTADVTALSGDLQVNGGTISSTQATLTINAAGAVDIQDNLTADTLTLDTGGLTIDGAVTDITTGTDQDLTVVANGAGEIILNDSVQIATLISGAATDGLLCRNGLNQITDCGANTLANYVTLQNAYVNGNIITASDASGDISFNLTEATNFVTDIQGTGSFIVQDGGTAVLSVADGGAVQLRNTIDSPAAFQIQNATGNAVVTADTTNGKVVLGESNSISGSLEFKTSGDGNSITLSAPNTVGASYSLSLPGTTPTTGLCLATSNLDATQLVFTSCFQQVSNADVTHVGSWETNGTNVTTINVSPTGPGNLLVLSAGFQQSSVITGISGGGVSSWQPITSNHSGSGSLKSVEMWRGVVTSAGASTITITYSGSSGTTDLAVEEYSMGTAFGTWSVDSAGVQFNASSTTITYPSLTPQNDKELYTGYAFVQNTPTSAGSTTGFTYRTTSGGHQVAYNEAASSGVPVAPTATQASSGSSHTIAATIIAFSNNNVIINSTNVQDGNFNVQASDPGTVAGVLQANVSGSGDILNLKDGAGNIVNSFGSTGEVLFQNSTDSTTAFQVLEADSSNVVLNVDTTNERVGVGTASAARKLEVLDASSPQLRLTHTDGTIYTDFQTDASGNLIVTNSGGTTSFTGNLSVGNALDVTGNADVVGSLTVGSADQLQVDATGNVTTTGSIDADGHIAIGADATVSANVIASFQEELTDLTADQAGISIVLDVNPGTGLAGNAFGQSTAVQIDASNNESFATESLYGSVNTVELLGSGDVYGGFGVSGSVSVGADRSAVLVSGVTGGVVIDTTGSVSNGSGLLSVVQAVNGTVTTLNGVGTSLEVVDATVTDLFGVNIATPTISGTGSVTNNYGLYVGDQSGVGSTNSYNVYSAGASSINLLEGDLQVQGGISLFSTAVTAGTIEATQFCTGDGETNCVTDFSSLIGSANIWTDGGSYIYTTNSEVLGNDAIAGANKIQGIYLADSASLAFGADNDVLYSFNDTTSTLEVVTGNNDIDFDGGTLFVDGSASSVGIGTTSPDRKLEVLDATNPQLRLTHADGTIYTDIETNASGNLIVTSTGGLTHIQTDLIASSLTLDTGDITLRNNETISNGTDGTVDINANITATSGDLQVNGGDIGIATDTDLLQLADDSLTVNGDGVFTGNVAVNGGILSSSTATLIINAAGSVDIQDNVTADSLTLDTGGLTIDGAVTDITTGTGQDLTVIANGAGVIDLNDSVRIGTLENVTANSATVCRDTVTGLLTACDTNTTGTPFLQGGNSFGAAGDLGTNDAQALNIITNGLTRLTVQANGDIAFDTNTLLINATTNNVGIGATPNAYKLYVNAGTGPGINVTTTGYNVLAAGTNLNAYGYFRSVDTSDTVSRFEIGAYDNNGVSGGRNLTFNPLGGNVGVVDATPDYQFEVQGSSGNGYFGITSSDLNTADIFGIDGSGNVRINTTGTADVASAKLYVVGNSQLEGVLRVGDDTNYLETNGSGQLRFFGSAQNSISVTLAPEFPGATLTGDGTNNVGIATSDFCSNGNTGLPNINPGVCQSGTTHNYYSWTANANNDYDVWLKWQVPSNFANWDSTPFQFNNWRQGTTEAITVTLHQADGSSCGTLTVDSTDTATSAWALSSLTTSCTPSPGEVMTIRVQLSVGTNDNFTRIGEIFINYLSAF